jgi:hypothetical protein
MYCESNLSTIFLDEELAGQRSTQKLERSNSLILEVKEKEAAERILNVFGMRSKLQHWKTHTEGLQAFSLRIKFVFRYFF